MDIYGEIDWLSLIFFLLIKFKIQYHTNPSIIWYSMTFFVHFIEILLYLYLTLGVFISQLEFYN